MTRKPFDLEAHLAANVPDKRRGVIRKALLGTCAPRAAIKAKCTDCCGYESLSDNIGNCEAFACPLRAFRPFQDNDTQDKE